jgi:hypothetical protein
MVIIGPQPVWCIIGGGNHQPAASHWQSIISHNVVLSTPCRYLI